MTLVSFIIPAHNEERHLPRTLEAIARSGPALARPWEVIVADDASTDRTPRIAEEAGARVVRHERRQIAATRNAGARAARGDTFFFVDADTMVTPEAVSAAMRAMDAGAVGGGAPVTFDGVIPLWARAALPVTNRLFRIFKLAGGCFFYCRREAFLKAGGWDETLYASEEIALAGALKQHGRFAVIAEPVITSGRKLRTHGGGELIRLLAKVAFKGPRRVVGDRANLDLWYAPRREDPGDPLGPSAPRT